MTNKTNGCPANTTTSMVTITGQTNNKGVNNNMQGIQLFSDVVEIAEIRQGIAYDQYGRII
jgi:hypothetical protein